jgi:ribokinase
VGFDRRGFPTRDAATRHNRVMYGSDGSRSWRVLSDAANFAQLSPVTGDIPEPLLSARFALILAMDLSAQEDLVAGLAARSVPVALDPQEDYIVGNEARILNMLDRVDVFLPSEIEIERLLGHRDFERAARMLAAHGCRVVVIKLGARGVLAYDACADHLMTAAPVPTSVIDTTGAGDAFSGGFMSVYAQTGNLEAAIPAGLVAAAFAIEDFGSPHLFDVTPEQAAIRRYGPGAVVRPQGEVGG